MAGASDQSVVSYILAATFALCTALFWGTYGPILHKGSVYMESYVPADPSNPSLPRPLGRMRPFLMVGFAYFVIAVVAPVLVMQFGGVERGAGLLAGWTLKGAIWSFAGGAVGALGAFFLIMALNNGTPVQVMPLVFGIAPVVSTAVGMYFNKTLSQVSPFFFVGMLLVILGAVTILLTAPTPKKPGAKPAAEKVRKETPEKAAPAAEDEKK
jgi:drug/metabolite transporter (DMT)-like permease